MTRDLYKYVFQDDSAMEDVESSLLLAIKSTEDIHGESQTRLDVAHFLDTENRTCVINAGTSVGKNLNRLFVGFINRGFGPDVYSVTRIPDERNPTRESVI